MAIIQPLPKISQAAKCPRAQKQVQTSRSKEFLDEEECFNDKSFNPDFSKYVIEEICTVLPQPAVAAQPIFFALSQ